MHEISTQFLEARNELRTQSSVYYRFLRYIFQPRGKSRTHTRCFSFNNLSLQFTASLRVLSPTSKNPCILFLKLKKLIPGRMSFSGREPFNTGSFLSIIVENLLSFSSHFRANFAMKSSASASRQLIIIKSLNILSSSLFGSSLPFMVLFFSFIAEPMFVTSLSLL